MSYDSKKKWSEYIALILSGICLGWLECTKGADDVSTILGIAVTIIGGTVLLGASVKFKKEGTGKNWMTQVVEAEKSVWPFAIFLIAFTLGPVLIELITSASCK